MNDTLLQINLQENVWDSLVMQEPDINYPKIEVKMKFDRNFFYIDALVKDTHLKDGDRSWRYGDGFFINFFSRIYPDKHPSNRLYSYGFSKIAGKLGTYLIYQNGKYFLSPKENVLKLDENLEKNILHYKISIPWSYLDPLHPLLFSDMGINIIYHSQNDDGSRYALKLIEDPYYDHEIEIHKKYIPISMKLNEAKQFDMSAKFKSTMVKGKYLEGNLSVFSPEIQTKLLNFTILNSRHEIIKKISNEYNLELGKNLIPFKLEISLKPGLYLLEVNQGNYNANTLPFIIVNYQNFLDQKEKIESTNLSVDNPLYNSSLLGLKYKFKELAEKFDNFDPEDDPKIFLTDIEKLETWNNQFIKNNHYYNAGTNIRTAIKSTLDKSLQPYSISFPQNFDPSNPIGLFLALHGSGVDDIGYAEGIRNRIPNFPFVIVAPRGRHKSDYWVGSSIIDVRDIILELKAMLKINHTIIFGFSAGGYGAWSIALRFPELCERIAIFSGCVVPTGVVEPEKTLEQYCADAIPNPDLKILVAHGTDDRAVPFDLTKNFVDFCKERGFIIDFKLVKGAGHGDYDMGTIMMKWFQENK